MAELDHESIVASLAGGLAALHDQTTGVAELGLPDAETQANWESTVRTAIELGLIEPGDRVGGALPTDIVYVALPREMVSRARSSKHRLLLTYGHAGSLSVEAVREVPGG